MVEIKNLHASAEKIKRFARKIVKIKSFPRTKTLAPPHEIKWCIPNTNTNASSREVICERPPKSQILTSICHHMQLYVIAHKTTGKGICMCHQVLMCQWVKTVCASYAKTRVNTFHKTQSPTISK